MLKPVAFFSVKSPKKLETVWPEMMNRIELRLRELPALGSVTGIKEQKKYSKIIQNYARSSGLTSVQ